MAPRGGLQETPVQSFERLRQCFDVIKEKHSDPWSWHEYLGDEPEDPESDEDEDVEWAELRPTARCNADRLKTHLLATIAELNSASAAADMCYYHICTNPTVMRDCVIILGTSADVDADMLLESGDGNPAKILSALQNKLNQAHEDIAKLELEIEDLKANLVQTNYRKEDNWRHWQEWQMQCEEAMMRLHQTTVNLNNTLADKDDLQAAFDDLEVRFIRAQAIMLYKGRQMLRDKILIQHKKENLFWAFVGFTTVVSQEKEERLRREYEEQRDAVEFALRNEVRFLLEEKNRNKGVLQKVVTEGANLRKDRRSLACRILYKYRPYEPREYYLWIWEFWQSLRARLVLEKRLDKEEARHAASHQMLLQASAQVPPMMKCIDDLRREIAAERIKHDKSRRELTIKGAKQAALLVEHLRDHRARELACLAKIQSVEMEHRDERIAVLEREIAEDEHVSSLKGMVVDLESRLRKSLDRRIQKSYLIPPGTGAKCAQCQRENLMRGWKLGHSASDPRLQSSPDASPRVTFSDKKAWAPLGMVAAKAPLPTATYSPQWR